MKLYIACRAGGVTGGPEALHQLADAANKFNLQSMMVYYPFGQTHEIPHQYKSYKFKLAEDIPDEENVIVLVAETETGVLRRFSRAKRAIWWLSIDNYYNSKSKFKSKIKNLIDGNKPLGLKDMSGITHFVQSRYALDHLAELGFTDVRMLSDYLNRKFLNAKSDGNSNRIDAVAYNPAKGREFTEKLISASPVNIQWIPIVNMSPKEVHELLMSVKVYIDFGNHPGKDRIPREAAISGACVITGRLGSASSEEDVSIPAEFKFDQERIDVVDAVLKKITHCINQFADVSEQFSRYRENILLEESIFFEEVSSLQEIGVSINK